MDTILQYVGSRAGKTTAMSEPVQHYHCGSTWSGRFCGNCGAAQALPPPAGMPPQAAQDATGSNQFSQDERPYVPVVKDYAVRIPTPLCF